MDREAVECYKRAGKIAALVKKGAPSYVKEGMRIIDLCETVEEAIIKLGGKPGFPCNVSVNEIAAHYTSPPGDETLIPTGSIVKLDFGVHVNGYIADNAVSISFNPEYEIMAKAAQESVRSAIESMRPGVKPSELGAIIQRTITRYGLKPIHNLTGHRIDRFTIHAGNAIPNVPDIDGYRISAGEVYAIEPFVTYKDAAGRVEDAPEAYIYRFIKEKGAKTKEAKSLLAYIKENFRTMPFTTRWLKDYQNGSYEKAFNELLSTRCVFAYPVLVESSGRPVAQYEDSVLITENGCEILTA